jgi:hypothetical protein
MNLKNKYNNINKTERKKYRDIKIGKEQNGKVVILRCVSTVFRRNPLPLSF